MPPILPLKKEVVMTKTNNYKPGFFLYAGLLLLGTHSHAAMAYFQCAPGCHRVGNQMSGFDCECPNPEAASQLSCETTENSEAVSFSITDLKGTEHTSTVQETFNENTPPTEAAYLYRGAGVERDEVDYKGEAFLLNVYVDYTAPQFQAVFTGIAGGFSYYHAPLSCRYYLY